ncbi:MAG: S1 family peptidase [Microcoleus sp.]
MKWRLLILIAYLVGLSIALPASTPDVKVSVKQQATKLSIDRLNLLARSITVRVLSGETLGSGIIVDKQGSVYQVLTNAHVLRSADPPYQIQTPEGKIHPAKLLKTINFHGNDLGLLQFTSPDKYAVANFGNTSPLKVGDEVFASGFAFPVETSQITPATPILRNQKQEGNTAYPVVQQQSSSFVFTAGKFSLMLDKALEGGYQIGYTNQVDRGMSGGPLLNRRGELVGINGLHANPLWDAPDLYQDGSTPSPPLQQKIDRLSWAVPIETFVQLVPQSVMPKSANTSRAQPL